MKNKNFIVFFIVLLLASFYFFGESFQSNKILFGSDTISISYPFKVFAKEMLFKYHILPVWMPQIFFGIPLIDSTNLIFFYPTDFIFYFLPITLEKTYFIDFFIHLILSFIGMYLFLRIIELKQESAILGGVFYMFSGVMVSFAYVGHFGNIKAAALIPYIFYFTKKGLNTGRLFYFLTASVFFALQILAIGIQIMAYTYLVIIFYFVYELFFNIKDKKNKVKFSLFFIISTIFIIFFSALQFFQSADYTKYSWRANFKYESFASWSFNPLETITFFLPQFFGLKDAAYWGDYAFNQTTYYIGILPFLLAVFSFKINKYKNYSIFFSFLSLLFLFLSYGGYSFIYKIFYYIPIFNSFRNPSRFLYVFTFTLITLSAIGFNNLILNLENRDKGLKNSFTAEIPLTNESKDRKSTDKKNIFFYLIITWGLITFFLIILGLNEKLLKNLLEIINNLIKRHTINDKMVFLLPMIKQDIFMFVLINIFFAAVVFFILKHKIKKIFIVFSLFLFLFCIDNFRINKKFILFADLRQFTAQGQFFEKILKEDNSLFRIANFSNIWYPPNMNILSKIESISGYHGLAPDRYYKLLENQVFNNIFVNNIFNVKYYLLDYEVNIPDFIKLYDDKIKIYKSKNVKERFVFYDKIKKFNNETEILGYLKNLNKETEEALVTDDIKIDVDEREKKYSIEILKYLPHEIELKVNTEKNGLLFVSNMYYPRWIARVNDKEAKVYNVNFAGIGVLLTKGENKIKFFYETKKITFSLILAVLALLIYILIFIKKI